MTTTTSTTTFDDTSTSPSIRRRWSIALAAGTLTIAGIAGGIAIADGSDSDTPVAPAGERVVQVVDERGVTRVGPVSADAAERRAEHAAVLRCSGLSADAVERCMSSGR